MYYIIVPAFIGGLWLSFLNANTLFAHIRFFAEHILHFIERVANAPF